MENEVSLQQRLFSDRVTNERLMQKVTDEVVFLNSEESVFRFEMSEGHALVGTRNAR